MNVLNQIFDDVITPFLEPRIKSKSIKAVKGYVKAVEVLRNITIAAYVLGVISSLLVVGVALMAVAIVGLVPIDPRAALWGVLVIGAVMTIIGFVFAYLGLNQKQWLQMSKANEMIGAVIEPWPTAYSVPDPRAIFRGEAKDPSSSNPDPSVARGGLQT